MEMRGYFGGLSEEIVGVSVVEEGLRRLEAAVGGGCEGHGVVALVEEGREAVVRIFGGGIGVGIGVGVIVLGGVG